jgi:hypothetical protein
MRIMLSGDAVEAPVTSMFADLELVFTRVDLVDINTLTRFSYFVSMAVRVISNGDALPPEMAFTYERQNKEDSFDD